MSSHLKGPTAAPVGVGTLQEALRRAAGSSEKLYFTDTSEVDRPYPFAQLFDEARSLAGSLAGLGVVPGDRVAMVLPTSPGFVRSYFGTLLAGAVPVPLYPPVRLGRMEEYHRRTARMLEVVGARTVLTDGRVRKLLGQAVDRARPPLGCHTLDDLASRGAKPLELTGAPSDLALIQFSSGSTADPKPAALNHANILANISAIDSFLPEGQGVQQAGVSWLPLYHDMGLIGCLLVAVLHAGALTLIPPELFLARPSLWLRAISRRKATVSPAPNFAYGLCLKRVRDEDMEGMDLSSWRLALNGAEPVNPEVLSRFIERFSRWGFNPTSLLPVYGLSEASLAVTFSKPGRRFQTVEVDSVALAREGKVVPSPAKAASDSSPRDPPRDHGFAQGGSSPSRTVVSVGTPLPGVEIKVCSDDGLELAEGQLGRVWVKSPSVMTGYYGNAEATARAIKGEWLDTGDLGFVSGGELFVCGRGKEVVILRGANHAPQEFEECLEGMEGVRAGCAVAFGFQPAGADGEELGLLVEWQGEAPPDLVEQIRGRVVERTGIRPYVVELLGPGTIPRTSSGKLCRLDAARLYQAGELKPPNPVTPFRVAVEVVRSEIGHLKSRFGRED